MRGFVVFLGLLLMLGGGAVAGVQYAPVDLAAYPQLDQLPGAREFLTSQMALYAGGGAAGFGLLLILVAALTGGKRERAVVKPPSMARETVRPRPKPAAAPARSTHEDLFAPANPPPQAAPKPPPSMAPPQAAAPPPRPQPATPQLQPAPRPAAPPPPAPATPRPQPAAATPPVEPPKAKPQASAQPPGAPPAALAPDPRMVNRKRVQDLVTINDALKAYHARHGAYPRAEGLAGANERGAGWIPGLSPDFLPDMPRDPLHGPETQYVYVSDGANYKLLAQGVSLVGSSNVEVLGIKIDHTRNPTAQNAAFGFWTPPFAGA